VDRKLIVFFLMVVAIVAAVNVVCQAQSQTLLTRHVREVTLNGHAQLVGRLPVTQSMNVDIVLALRGQPELENFLQELYDPSSPSYRHFVTVPQFTERFGPSQEDYEALIGFAKANGFTLLGGSRDSMDVQLKGSVATIERAFHVTMGVYQHPTENRTFYAPDREPMVDLPFQLWHISGLDNYAIPRPMFVKRDSQAQVRPQPEAVTGSCPGQSFCGSDMRAAYYEGTALTGSGQNIGLLEYAGFDIADVNTYYKNAGQTRTFAVTGISTDGSSINCTEATGCDDTEQTIDITQAGGMAPGVTTVYVYVSDNSDTALLGAMSSDTPLPLSLSSSWTWSPADPATDDPYFEKMASQGQSFFQATGDSGGYEGNAPWPANSAYVVAVGGTDLTTSGPGGPWASETAWSDGGGGWGTNVDIPSWQVAAVAKCTGCSQTYRDVPDVAANANFSFYVCADQSGCTENEYGGTSFAAPMWAGYLALANQQAAANGVPAPGFIDPTIYPLNLGNSDADFHDITSGSNGFTCSAGYNLCDGWGSPNSAALINALTAPAGPNFTLSANPTSVTITQGGTGTSTITIAPEDGFSGNVTLSTSGLPSGVTAVFNPNPATTTSTLTLTASASAATGTVTVTITGTSGSLTNTTTLSLTVNASGSGPAVTLSPTSLSWGKIKVGTTTAAKIVTLTNSGTATLTFSSITISGDFQLVTGTKTCGNPVGTVAAGKNCYIKVTFNPTQTGKRTGSVTINDNAPNSPQSIPLSGTGR
jgi:subtilase family serine protease